MKKVKANFGNVAHIDRFTLFMEKQICMFKMKIVFLNTKLT